MLPQALKLKVIQQYEAGKLQKDIAHDLGISTGSVSTILKASKDKHSDSIPREQPSVVAKKDLQIISQPPSPYKKEPWEQQQPSPVISSSSFLPSVPSRSMQTTSVTVRRDGGPFSYLGMDNDDQDEATKKDEEFEPSLSNPQDNRPIDWDPDEGYGRRLWTRILEEKKQLGQEKDSIAYERCNIELERKQLEYERRNLYARLAEIEKYRDILPSAKQLRDDMGVGFHEIITWIEVIRDKAATEGITPKEAVALIVQELKLYNQFNSLKRSVERAQQDLEVLNIAIEQKQQAYRSLVDLKSKGVSDTDLVELNNLIYRWSAGGWSQNNGNMSGFNLRLDEKLNVASHN